MAPGRNDTKEKPIESLEWKSDWHIFDAKEKKERELHPWESTPDSGLLHRGGSRPFRLAKIGHENARSKLWDQFRGQGIYGTTLGDPLLGKWEGSHA